jgi:hypothetical protein
MVAPNQVAAQGAKIGGLAANLASIAGLAVTIADRSPGPDRASAFPGALGLNSLNIALHLSILSAIAFGIFWSIAERKFGWEFEAGGGERLPAGWSAVALSICITLPLAFVPVAYQRLTGIRLLLPLHWRAMFLVALMAVGSELFIYGLNGVPGLRQRFAPTHPDTPLEAALVVEAIYTLAIVGISVLTYRMIVDPTEPVLRMAVGRILLPCLVYFSGMAVFTALRYPESVGKPSWVHVRGLIAGLLLMFSLCGGMFL